MANIGTFKKSGTDYLGEIVTLSVQTKNVRIVPEATRANDNAPSYRIFVGRAEIGAAWSKRSAENRDYLSVKLDDPSFNAPIYANLFDDEDGDGFTLIWSRVRKANGDCGQPATPRSGNRAGLLFCQEDYDADEPSGSARSPPTSNSSSRRSAGFIPTAWAVCQSVRSVTFCWPAPYCSHVLDPRPFV